MTNKEYMHKDITDSPKDAEKLKGDEAVMNLPEIKDIPGAARSTKNASLLPGDTTVSSADEEADDLLEDNDDLNNNSDVSLLEKKLLRDSFDPAYDIDLPVNSISLDDKDNEGDLLEEGKQADDLFGKDLDETLNEEEDEESEGENQQ
jgi:hypothetical protein